MSGDSFEDLYTAKPPYDESVLAETVGDLIKIHEDTGEPVLQSEYYHLGVREQVISLMLYRHIGVELEEIDEEELSASPIWFDRNSDAEESEIVDYPSELDFVREDEDGELYIPSHAVETAIAHLTDT